MIAKFISRMAPASRALAASMQTPLVRQTRMIQSTASLAVQIPNKGAVPDSVWNLGKLNHVAIAVPNLDQAISLFKNVLNAKSISEKLPQPDHGVYTVFIDLGNTKIELLYPLGEKSPIKAFLQKNANGGIHHICIEVDNINAAMKSCIKNKIRCLSDEPKIGAHGKPVVFLHPKDCCGILVELEQV